MTDRTIPRLVTVGVIADELGTTPARVTRIIRTRPHIRPRAWAGNSRLFSTQAIAQVAHEIEQQDARKARRAGGDA